MLIFMLKGKNVRLKREKEKKKKEILDAAEKLFLTEGFKETSMDEIAKKSEFSKRTVYKYFGSKEELFSEIAFRGIEKFKKIILESIKDQKTGFDKIRAIAESIVNLKKINKNYAKVIFYFLTQSVNKNKTTEGLKNCKILMTKILELIQKFIEEGINDGSIKNGVDVSKIGISAQTIFLGLYLIDNSLYEYLLPDNITFNEIFEYSINILLSIIKH